MEIIPENEKNNVVLRNANKNNNEKIILNNNGKAQDKLNNLDMNNIIASVSRDSVKQNNNQIIVTLNGTDTPARKGAFYLKYKEAINVAFPKVEIKLAA